MGCGNSTPVATEPRELGLPAAKKQQQAVKVPKQLVKRRHHKAVPLLMALDDELAEVLASGAIKLIGADFMKQSTQPHLLRRQDLEALERDEQIAVFLEPDEAVALLRSNNRAIAALTYGWVTPDHPDVTDEYLANVRRFLNHPLGAHIGGCFWDFGSLPQRPRTDAEKKLFNQALGCMGDVYASAMGTTVVRHRTIPKRPEGHEGVYNDRDYENRGWCCLETGVSGEAIAYAQYYKGLDAVLKRLPPKIIEIDGDGPRVADADEVGGGDEGRGPRIERVRASIKAAKFTGKGDDKVVVGLYNVYIVKISTAMAGSGETVKQVYEGKYNAAGEREGYGTMRFATGSVYEGQWKGGKQEGRGTYRFANGDVYEGEYKGGKEERRGTYRHAEGHVYEGEFKECIHGRGTYRYADGGVFEGEFKVNKMDGPGTLRAADGSIVVGFFRESASRAFIVSGCSINAGTLVGEGVKWSADRQTAVRLLDGQDQEEISLEEARRVAAEHGLPEGV